MAKNKKGGFIKLIILFILIVAILAYFNIDIKQVVESQPVQVIWGFVKVLWLNYIYPAAEYLWNNFLKEFIFENLVDFFGEAKDSISDSSFNDLINTATTTSSSAQ